jgi:5-carboxymethyl-2-hydroxymuconate isomerase
MAKAKIDTYKADAKRRADRLEVLEKSLGEMTDSMQERAEIPAMYEALKATVAEKTTLESEVRSHAKWKTLHDLAEKKHAEMKTVEEQAFAARDQEDGALSEKRELIATITSTIEERANKITAPATVAIQIGQDVRFFMDLPGGRRVPREGASGAEGVEFDIALSAALLDGEGVVVAEVAELDEARLPLLLQKIRSVPGNVQALIIGHNLKSAPDDVDVNFLNMENNA